MGSDTRVKVTTSATCVNQRQGRSVAWKPHDLDEKLVDLTDDIHEFLKADRLGDIGVGVQSVAAQDVFLGGRGSQHNDGDMTQVRIGFDLFQQLATVILRQVQVEQDQVRLRRVLMTTALVEKVEAFLPVACHPQSVANLVVFECFPGGEDVPGIVFDEQDLDSGGSRCHRWAPWVVPAAVSSLAGLAGKVNQRRVPMLVEVSIPMVPPCSSTIFLHNASPIPVPV